MDVGGGRLPPADEAGDKHGFAARSLGIIARIDLIEGEDSTVAPVDTKKCKHPHVTEGAYEPDASRSARRR